MTDDKRKEQIRRIIEEDLPDTIGITAVEYLDAGFDYRWKTGERSISKDYKYLDLAIKSYERSAALGNVRAMGDLGIIYSEIGDMEQSYQWYLEAALGGDRAAVYRIGMMHHNGDYVSQDYERAHGYFMRAFELGFPSSAYFLGLYAEKGFIKEPDMDEAVYYYQEGAEMHSRDCIERLKDLGLYNESDG